MRQPAQDGMSTMSEVDCLSGTPSKLRPARFGRENAKSMIVNAPDSLNLLNSSRSSERRVRSRRLLERT